MSFEREKLNVSKLSDNTMTIETKEKHNYRETQTNKTAPTEKLRVKCKNIFLFEFILWT